MPGFDTRIPCKAVVRSVYRERYGVLCTKEDTAMAQFNMRHHSQRVIRFVTVQLIALVGWIVVQSLFSLSSFGRTLPFALMIVVEAVWWIATLLIMFLLFQREYNRFAQAALELEEANRRLRE